MFESGDTIEMAVPSEEFVTSLKSQSCQYYIGRRNALSLVFQGR